MYHAIVEFEKFDLQYYLQFVNSLFIRNKKPRPKQYNLG